MFARQSAGLLPGSFDEADGRVSVFQFHPDPNLFIHYFDEADEEWLHFAACNRRKDLFVGLRREYALVDIVGGKVADDKTAVTLNNYVSGAYGTPGTERADRMATDLLEADCLKDQFCFRTEEAVASLTYLKSGSYAQATDSPISQDQKDATAIIVMRCMLLTLAEEQGIPFEEALLSFAQSRTYVGLFDFDAEVWKEGPEYLRCFYDEELCGGSE